MRSPCFLSVRIGPSIYIHHNILEAYDVTLLSVYVLLSLLGNRPLPVIIIKYDLFVSSLNSFSFCAVRVVSKEINRILLPRTSCYNVEFLILN
jgi:hypothetical protein